MSHIVRPACPCGSQLLIKFTLDVAVSVSCPRCGVIVPIYQLDDQNKENMQNELEQRIEGKTDED